MSILLNSLNRTTTNKLQKVNLQKELQTAVSGTEHTVTTETRKKLHRELISDPFVFQKANTMEKAPQIAGSISPENMTLLAGSRRQIHPME